MNAQEDQWTSWAPGKNLPALLELPGPFPVLGGKAELLHPAPAKPQLLPLHRHPDLEGRLLLVPWLPFLCRKISSAPLAPPTPPPPPPKSIFPLRRLHPTTFPALRAIPWLSAALCPGLLSAPSLLSLPSELSTLWGRTAPLLTEGQLMGSGSEFPFQHSSVWIPICLNTSVTGNLRGPGSVVE